MNDLVEKLRGRYGDDKLMIWFKKTCLYEAISCFLLYCVAMVWKRYAPEGLASTIFIIIIGNLHGLFFTLYLLLCLPARKIYNWDDEDFVFSLLSAFFPFATIWVDRQLARKDRN
ncbi:MAG: DUF3817 domain-containing protein [Bergeyella zoohelcum]|nr:DUF3817 domain-containing protein [Bergeyella zoohelcum]